MAKINSYMTFNGNCREAMVYYQNIFGGELSFQTIGESPLSDQMPIEMKDKILHSLLINGKLQFMASDMVGNSGLSKGNSLSLVLNCDMETQLRTIFTELSKNGKVNHPLEISFWGALFGDLTDKYGFHWLLTHELAKKQ